VSFGRFRNARDGRVVRSPASESRTNYAIRAAIEWEPLIPRSRKRWARIFMPDQHLFHELLERVRRGDADAAAELVRKYESAIRVAVRTRLSDPRLRRQFDSMDVCQSVLASFFLRAAAGQYDLRDPAQLVALLTKMAHNKLAMRARSQYRQRRDVRRNVHLGDVQPEPAAKWAEPSEHMLGREFVDRAFGLMDPQVREMAVCRAGGMEWSEIASQFGGTADARRKQFQRAIDRIAETLEID
jgi:RNA polymerase sigma factor (sigma-70 family)